VDDYDAHYPIVVDPLIWTEQQKLLVSDGAVSDWFGWPVAIQADTALVGASWDDDQGSASGSAYVFSRNNGLWQLQQKLTPTDGSEFAHFGCAVALSNDTALIGASGDDVYGEASGSAFVFVRTAGVWTKQQKLVPNSGVQEDGFGAAVALQGDTAMIGAPHENQTSSYAYTPSVYVFTRSNTVWQEQQQLTVADGKQGHFGVAVALDNDTALVGAPYVESGAAYVFGRVSGVWTERG